MKKRNRTGLAALSASITLADGKAPTSITLLKYGPNESDYGCFTFDEVAAAMVMQAYERKGIERLYADWNHGTIQRVGDPAPTREQAKSSCSFIPMVNAQGDLVASEIEWTEKGRSDVESRDYNLFSPAFDWTWGDDDICRPSALLNFALVNRAGLNDIQPILAAAAAAIPHRKQETRTMDEKLETELRNRISVVEGELADARKELATARLAGSGLVALSAAVGLRPDVADADRLATITGLATLRADVLKATGKDKPEDALSEIAGLVTLRADVLRVAGKKTVAEAIGAIEGHKTKADGYDELAAKAAERETATLSAELAQSIERGKREGKIVEAVSKIWEEDALAYGGGKPTKEGIAKLNAKIDASPKIVTMVDDKGTPRPADGTVALTAAELDFAKKHGKDPALMLKAKQDIANQNAARKAARTQ